MSDHFHNPINDRARHREDLWMLSQEAEARQAGSKPVAVPAQGSAGSGSGKVAPEVESGLTRFFREFFQGFSAN